MMLIARQFSLFNLRFSIDHASPHEGPRSGSARSGAFADAQRGAWPSPVEHHGAAKQMVCTRGDVKNHVTAGASCHHHRPTEVVSGFTYTQRCGLNSRS